MHDTCAHARFDDLDIALDFEQVCKARPSCFPIVAFCRCLCSLSLCSPPYFLLFYFIVIFHLIPLTDSILLHGHIPFDFIGIFHHCPLTDLILPHWHITPYFINRFHVSSLRDLILPHRHIPFYCIATSYLTPLTDSILLH